MLSTLTQSEQVILKCITDAPIAWQTIEQLAIRSKLSLEETNEVLVSLDLEGWVTSWEPDGVLSITLTSLAAERLKVQLVEMNGAGLQRWIGLGNPLPSPYKSKMARGGDADVEFFETIADSAPPPDIAVELSELCPEETERLDGSRSRVMLQFLPRPTILLGLGHTPWPNASEVGKHRSCPVCGSKPLAPKAYCLWCDRWGLDPLLFSRSSKGASQAPGTPRACPKRNRPDQAHRDREIRKERRKQRHQALWATRPARPATGRKAGSASL